MGKHPPALPPLLQRHEGVQQAEGWMAAKPEVDTTSGWRGVPGQPRHAVSFQCSGSFGHEHPVLANGVHTGSTGEPAGWGYGADGGSNQ